MGISKEHAETWGLLCELNRYYSERGPQSVVSAKVRDFRAFFNKGVDDMVDPEIPDDEDCYIAHVVEHLGEVDLVRRAPDGKRIFYYSHYDD